MIQAALQLIARAAYQIDVAEYLMRRFFHKRAMRRHREDPKPAPPAIKICPRCEDCDIPVNASICSGCEDEIREDAPGDGQWVNTPHGWIYE